MRTGANRRRLAQRQYSKGPQFAPVRQLRRSLIRPATTGAAQRTRRRLATRPLRKSKAVDHALPLLMRLPTPPLALRQAETVTLPASLSTIIVRSNAPSETALQRSVAPLHPRNGPTVAPSQRRCGATAGAVTASLYGTEVVLHRGGAGQDGPPDASSPDLVPFELNERQKPTQERLSADVECRASSCNSPSLQSAEAPRATTNLSVSSLFWD
jgi:hypothetical protein